jgi:hypothetical protein
MKPKTVKIHPAAEAYRLMTDEELASLAADMAANGQRDIIGRVNGAVSEALVDGRNRLRACEIAGIEPRFETIQFENDEEIKAFVKSRGERRNISKGEQAMAVAWLYPETSPGKRTKGSATTLSETNKVSTTRLSQARTVYHYSRELAAKVRDGIVKLDKALEQVDAARKELESTEVKLVRLRAEAPDLADQVDEERLTLTEAYAAFEQRKHDEEEKEKNRRETTVRITEDAYRNLISFGNDEFIADTMVLIGDPEFRRTLIARVRIDPQFLPHIKRGGPALLKLLSLLMEE